ncbi:MAG: ATP-binding protein [Flavobacteriaceae bacterium]|nr:ATP-binding protein [Flavobacteriaceae bacterium]
MNNTATGSLRRRIFTAMVALVLLSTLLVGVVTVYHYRSEIQNYHRERLGRKEAAIRESIAYSLRTTSYEITTENLPFIFREDLYRIADIHNLPLQIFDLEGNLLKDSKQLFAIDRTLPKNIDEMLLENIKQSPGKRLIVRDQQEEMSFRSSFSYILDLNFKPIGILHIRYEEENYLVTKELQDFLLKIGQVFAFIFLVSILISFLISGYIIKSLKSLSAKIASTDLNNTNQKLDPNAVAEELQVIVDSYNNMVDKLEESVEKLALSEREQAWREMAKQVAHEIKNPLTPMRLSIQNFERKFNPNDPNNPEKIKKFSQTLIEQIDTMSEIASAFSNFADISIQKNQRLELNQLTLSGINVFDQDIVRCTAFKNQLWVNIDKNQYLRMLTNLVKNALQAAEEKEHPSVKVSLSQTEGFAHLCVSDNGSGIPETLRERIFEPKFTTKSKGMGLGLAIVKKIITNAGGSIDFKSDDSGTTFIVKLPLTEND